jgi:hypothetical protein
LRQRDLRPRLFIGIISLIALLVFISLPLEAFPAERPLSKTYQTRYSTVRYSRDAELTEFGIKILMFDEPLYKYAEKDILTVAVRDNVDAIVDRVKTLLDMNPRDLRFTIRIYPAHSDIKAMYLEHGMLGKAPYAFYSHNERTIYVSLEMLTPGMLAHETAHAVMNSYFAVPPPADMQEVLARYVDRHLWDK